MLKIHKIFKLLSLLFIFSACHSQPKENEQKFKFTTFNDQIFALAKKENKPVLLHLRANWCHWCHVMEKETYANPKVQAFLEENYIYAMEDHDERADLTALYGEYGWPATLIFSPDGKSIFKQAGYINTDEFIQILTQYKNPNTWNPNEKTAQITPEHKNKVLITEKVGEVEQQMLQTLDVEVGGFRSEHKFLELATTQYAFNHFQNRPNLKEWLVNSIENSFHLVDPVWGGVYQYSTNRDWNHLHFEKLLNFQGDYIQMYVQYYQLFKNPKALENAKAIAHYVAQFLTDKNGGFYNAQDADLVEGKKATDYFNLNDKERRALGIPKIDSNVYTNTSMQYATALLHLYEVTKDTKYLNTAQNAIDMLLKTRLKDGLMQHHERVSNISNANDQLYTIDALMTLYQVVKNEKYVQAAHQLLNQTVEKFYVPKASYLNAFVGKTAIASTYNATDNMLFAKILKTYFVKNNPNYEKLYWNTMDFLTHKVLLDNYVSEAGLINAL